LSAVEKIKEEFHTLLPPMIFFFVALHLVSLVRALMLTGTGVALPSTVTITIAALIIAKAVVIADMLPFINRFPHRPLIYNIAWKTTIYVFVAMSVHYLERLHEFWRDTGGLAAANEKMLAEMIWPHFWATEIFLSTLIFMYCAMRELTRAIGRDKVHRLFFGPMPDAPAGH
jgi:hypothetical protein